MYAVGMIKQPTAYLTAACSLVLALSACGNKATEKATASPAAAAGPQTDEQKTLYALGLLLGRNVKVFNLTPEELELVKKGMGDSVTGAKPAVELDTFGPKINELAQARIAAGATAEKTKGKTFAEAAGKETGATVLPSGLVFKSTSPGTGASPKPSDTVRVHYEGKLVDGTVFDTSIKNGPDGKPMPPAEFPVTGVITCWTEAVQKMKVGEKATIVCPSDIAYGDQGRPPTIPAGATLVFNVELVGIGGGQASAAPEAGHPAHPGHSEAETAPAAAPAKKTGK
jgi:FKBP-type peptidyl-prolyl cis-trans isomerase FkpA